MEENYNVLILPDIHGRTFYRKPVNDLLDKVEKIIFLGDYLDPYYPYENITSEDSIENFKVILDLKKKYPEKIILLLGNHDCHYLSADIIGHDVFPCSRFDFDPDRLKIIYSLFKNNFNIFKFLYKMDNVLFSHAGVVSLWIRYCGCSSINEIIEDESKLINYLWCVSKIRGGSFDFGSCVWNDVREFSNDIPNLYQVFGHTMLKENPIITDTFACLDVKKPFIMNTKNLKIKEYYEN